MNDLKGRSDNLSVQLREIKSNLAIEKKKDELKKLEAASTDPNLWNDQDHAREIMQTIGDLKKELDTVATLEGDIATVRELAEHPEEFTDLEKEIARIERELGKFKLASYLSGQYDRKNAIIGIHAGQGGTEAMDWVSMLLRMYMHFAESRGWAVEVLDQTPGEEAGIKSVTFKVGGPYAYGYLKGEAGTHRLVRQSPFNADKLRQTSFALVEVLPELEDKDIPELEINDEDLDWQFYRAGGHGGQNVNKVSTAVRLKHIPTNIVVTAQTERFQEQNRKIALNLLRAKLWALEEEKAQKTKEGLKGEYRPASWGTQIRSYVLHPYKMVKDLRTEVESPNPDAVLAGELDEFIEAELKL